MDFRCPVCHRFHPEEDTFGFRCLASQYLIVIQRHRLGGHEPERRFRDGEEMSPWQENALRSWEDADR